MSANYDKSENYKVLPGANTNSGGRYEYLMAGFVALKLLQDSTIADFRISTNNQKFGKFDDLVVETTSEHGAEHTWAFQLKHNQTGKPLTRNELGARKGDFGIQKYFEDYKKPRYTQSEATLFLYTNRQWHGEKQFEIEGKPYILRTAKISNAKNKFFDTSRNSSIYQITIEPRQGCEQKCDENELKDYRQFLSKFFLCSDQSNVDEMERDISKIFTDIYKTSTGEDRFMKFVEVWSRTETTGSKKKLMKADIKTELGKILLEPHMVPISQMESSDKGEVLKRVISDYNVTVLPGGCRELIKHLWTTCDAVQDWNSSDLPLVVNFDANNQHSVYSAIDLCPNPNFVLVGDCVDVSKLEHLKVFQNLSDLHGESYTIVVENFSCVIQGRENTELDKILKDNANLENFFGVGELFRMLDRKPFVIGDDVAPLPTPYLERSILRKVLNLEIIIENLTRDALVIAIDDSSFDWDAIRRKIQGVKNKKTVMLTSDDNDFLTKIARKQPETPLIILIKGTCCADQFNEICNRVSAEKNLHHFQIGKEHNLVWIRTRGKITYLKEFQTVDDQTIIADSDFSQIFSNKFNVLSADPGMGKSVFMNSQKRRSKLDFWPVLINVREKVPIFKRNFRVSELVGEILSSEKNELAKRLQNEYNREQCIVFLWDGLDEVGMQEVKCILDGIKKISTLGYSQWITSRRHLNEMLEDFFDVLSFDLKEITSDDQKKFIEERLEEYYEDKIDEVTRNIFDYTDKSKLKNILGIPLVLDIFTQICLDKTNYQRILDSELTWIGIYDTFINGKFEHYSKKVSGENNALFSAGQKSVKEIMSACYQKSALKVCFDDSIFEKLNLNCDDFLENIAIDGDVYGIITKVNEKTIMFVHQTFAEYFSALYLANNFKRLDREILELLFREEYRTVRLFFDMCLAQNCPAHLAVLELNVDKFQNFLQSNKVHEIFLKDKGGRNCLHIACSYGVARPPLKKMIIKRNTIFDAQPLESSTKEHLEYEIIIKIIVNHLRYNMSLIHEFMIILDKDEVFGINCLQYADLSMSIFPIIAIIAAVPGLLDNIEEWFCNYKDIESFIAYSIIWNYEHFVSSLKQIPYFECKKNRGNYRNFPGSFHSNRFDSLMLMTQYGRVDMLKKALQNKTNVRMINAVFNKNHSLLSWATRKDNLDIVKLLTQNEVSTNQLYGKEKNDILHLAAKRRNMDIAKYLIDSKFVVEISRINLIKKTPLLNAVQSGNFETAEYLIAQGAKIEAKDSQGYNILHWACLQNQLNFIKTLTRENLTKLDESDNEGKTPLLLAADLGKLEICKHLIENGANINAKGSNGRNVLHVLVACRRKNKLEIIKNLTRENLVMLDESDNSGKTPLLLAVDLKMLEICKYLVENGANILAKQSNGRNVLHLACERTFLKFIKFLTPGELRVLDERDYFGYSPLLISHHIGNLEIQMYLIDMGVDVF